MNTTNFPERINFNQSLLLHSLSKSQANLSNRSNHKRSCSSLLSELNMTYSRLTLATKYDQVKQSESIQDQIQYQFQQEDSIQQSEISLQNNEVNFCANCLSMQNQLTQIQVFLLQIERKFIQKQLLLTDQYKALTEQLYKKNQKLQRCQIFCNQLQQQIQSLKGPQNLPKLSLNTAFKPFNTAGLSSQTTKNFMKSGESTKASQNRLIRNTINQSIQMPRGKETDKYNSPLRKVTQPNESIKKSLINSVNLSYTESERQMTTAEDPFKSLSYQKNSQTLTNTKTFKNANTFTNLKTKNTQPDQPFNVRRDCEFSKLIFQNSNLKSYNSVLLQHVKPKSLAQKIFAFRKH